MWSLRFLLVHVRFFFCFQELWFPPTATNMNECECEGCLSLCVSPCDGLVIRPGHTQHLTHHS